MQDYPELVLAIWRDDLKAIRRYSRQPDVLDADGRTGLMAAATDNKSGAASILLEAGADPSIRDPAGWSALHFAAQSGAKDVALLLIGAGANIDAVDSYGNTPLSTAVFVSRGGGELIGILRDAGADPHAANNYGVSPVALARTIANHDVAQFFSDLP